MAAGLCPLRGSSADLSLVLYCGRKVLAALAPRCHIDIGYRGTGTVPQKAPCPEEAPFVFIPLKKSLKGVRTD